MSKVSVIIPAYNSEKYIQETIKSVLNQTYHDIEIIVCDDGSTDKTRDLVAQFGDKVKYIYQTNSGCPVARNTAISLSRGQYIAFVDHDDLWLPDKLERQINAFELDKEIGLIYSDSYILHNNTLQVKRYSELEKQFRGNTLHYLFMSNFIPILTVVVKKEVLNKVGLFDPRYLFAEDYDILLRVAEHYKIDYIEDPLAKYRIHKNGLHHMREYSLPEDIMLLKEVIQRCPWLKSVLGKKVNKRFADLHTQLGWIYFFKGETLRARKEFISSIKKYPLDRQIYKAYVLTFFKNRFGNMVRKLKKSYFYN